ncbi:hypothetical protein NECAME_00502 [Necator americanus]|uniref:Uncharacterized protein n=1 Tax=Necator americanus TaxID=51031 RepID=W2T729_NECAM|nr:hypothetical protein NECAME_00502 [Necator americanus]ETN76976.1 hypothetical protein NECAME_00502 [Necator americanus]
MFSESELDCEFKALFKFVTYAKYFRNLGKFDFAISFSSIEHSGLGRWTLQFQLLSGNISSSFEDNPLCNVTDEDGIPYRDTISTAKGLVTYDEIDRNVFHPNNYRIVKPSFPIPKLDFISRPTCEKVFEDWLEIAKGPAPQEPPRTIRNSEKNAYLLNGYSVEHRVISVYYALRDYPVKDMVGFVIGSQRPWIEVQALRSGASKVYTVEYQEIKIVGTEKIIYINPITFAEQWKDNMDMFDFAISFSSIEHSGLGRYGDPPDPIGDLREVQKVLCLLKKGGLFFIGLPRGRDGILYNLHRLYGRIRLAMIMAGFELIAVYTGSSPYPQYPRREDFEILTNYEQELYVLRKP